MEERTRRAVAAVEATGDVARGYEVVACDESEADTAVFCEKYGYPASMAANAIVVATRKEPRRAACCVVLATHRLDVNGTVKRRLGGKCSFASAELMHELTGMEVGGVTPFGLPDDLPLWICASVLEPERVIVGDGGRTAKLIVPPRALAALPGAEVVEELSQPRV